jgi:SAM-dependent methyltransferase
MAEDFQSYWDDQAATFDEEPDHGLADPFVRAAWTRLLRRLLPQPPAELIDVGCGTGSVSVLLAEQGYEVRGLDFSARMIAAARDKAEAAGVSVAFQQGDASAPSYPLASADVVIARHVLWALPDPSKGLASWFRLLRPGGRLLLIEGRWATGAGISAEDCKTLVARHGRDAVVEQLDDPALWGRETHDERYALVSLS